MAVVRSLNQHFFKEWTSEMAYVLGYFAADGSMLKNSRGAHFIEFVSTDNILIDIVRTVTGSNHYISVRDVRHKCKPLYRIQIGSKEWFQDLLRHGFTQAKSNRMQFPNIPPNMLGHFVRGYFDGDGCVYFKQHWSTWHKKLVWVLTTGFTSGSCVFLTTLMQSLHASGLKGGHISKKARGGYDLVFSRLDSLALYHLMYNTAEVRDLFLPRKKEKLERAVKTLWLDKTVRS